LTVSKSEISDFSFGKRFDFFDTYGIISKILFLFKIKDFDTGGCQKPKAFEDTVGFLRLPKEKSKIIENRRFSKKKEALVSLVEEETKKGT
jgi:hypothetical protein